MKGSDDVGKACGIVCGWGWLREAALRAHLRGPVFCCLVSLNFEKTAAAERESFRGDAGRPLAPRGPTPSDGRGASSIAVELSNSGPLPPTSTSFVLTPLWAHRYMSATWGGGWCNQKRMSSQPLTTTVPKAKTIWGYYYPCVYPFETVAFRVRLRPWSGRLIRPSHLYKDAEEAKPNEHVAHLL